MGEPANVYDIERLQHCISAIKGIQVKRLGIDYTHYTLYTPYMPQVTVYIRKADYPKWKAIVKKTKFISDALNG